MESTQEEEVDGSEAGSSDTAEDGAADPFALVIDELNRVREQLEQLVNIQVDRLKLQWRDRLLHLAWIAVAAVVLLTATVAAVFYAMAGLAGLFSAALESPPWVGDLVAGGLFLIVLGGALGIGSVVLRWRNLARLQKSYGKPAASGKQTEARS